jgi:hypothetical protein
MDNKKFEQLIDLIINENEEQARELFHDIVVEKSREIYESMMADEEVVENFDGMGESDQVGGLLDEIGAEEEGMTEEDDEFADIEMSDDDEEMGGEEEHEEAELEDRVVDLEDKLDELMAEFEELMGHEEEEMGDDDMGGMDDMGGDDMGMGDEEMMEAADEEEDDSLEESIQLQKVSVTHGDNGSNTKSPALTKPKVVQTGAKAVNMTGTAETVPTGPKAPGNYGTKGETSVKHANDWKNSPAHKGAKTEAAPKPQSAQATQVNTKSPVAESKKVVKKKV